MKKILAMDFDGTLYPKIGQGLRKEDVEALKRFRSKGNLAGLNTGRCLFCMDNFHEDTKGQLQLDFYAGDSGSCAADENKEPFYLKALPYELVAKVVRERPDLPCCVSADGIYVGLHPQSSPLFCKSIVPVETLRDQVLTGFCFALPDGPSALELKKILEEEGWPLSFHNNGRSLDMGACGCTKGTVLKVIADHFHLPMEQVYAIGDGLNDLEAIRTAHVGFAMKNGHPLLKQEADYVVESVAEAIRIIEELDDTAGK